MEEQKKIVKWLSKVPSQDDFGYTIDKRFVDGKTKQGPWAIMTPGNFRQYGIGKYGLGLGQMYEKQKDGSWTKIRG